jgi:hypothetical protein
VVGSLSGGGGSVALAELLATGGCVGEAAGAGLAVGLAFLSAVLFAEGADAGADSVLTCGELLLAGPAGRAGSRVG